MNVKQAGKKGSGANPASTLAKGLVPEKWQQFPKGKSHGERGDEGRWRSQRSRIGASSSEARSGRVRPAESPYRMYVPGLVQRPPLQGLIYGGPVVV